ncbi:MAG: hypothetical protein IKL96_11780 [Kiritimatiellae bacterium]|nr:hypothetical protein [Kiritimatiellia bacterium]
MEFSLQNNTLTTISIGILLPRDGSKCIIPTGRSQCPRREVIRDAHTARTSEADRRSPKGERGRQIAAVRSLVREARAAGKRMSILRACRKAWQNVKGGYPSVKALYHYCHNHAQEF